MSENRYYCNRFYKKTIKNISGAMAAVTLVSCGASVYAVNNQKPFEYTVNNGYTEDKDKSSKSNFVLNTESQEGENNEGGITNPENPESNSKDINVSVNYFADGDNTYTVIVSSLDYLAGYKNYAFVIETTADGAEISNVKFGDKLKGGTILMEGVKKIGFTKGSESTLQEGKLTFCSFTLKSEVKPSAENISVTGFSAVDGEDKEISFKPVLTVNEGPVVPTLSEKEQKVYDSITALPDVSKLSFYNEDETLVDTDDFLKQVTDTETAYASLNDAEKANVNAVLEYNMENKDIVSELKPVATAMSKAAAVISQAKTFSQVTEDKMLSYQFMLNVYNDKIKNTVSGEGLPDGSKIKTEYDAAVAAIDAFNTAMTEKVSVADFSKRIDAVSAQLDVIISIGDNKYYNDYLDDLLAKSEALYDEIDKSDVSGKKYMCQDLEEKIDGVEAVKKGISEKPTVSFPEDKSITQGGTYQITVKRSNDASKIDGKVTVKVYVTKNDEEVLKDTWEFDIANGKTSATGKHTASGNLYPSGKIKVEVSYTVGGITTVLDSETIQVFTSSPATGNGTGNIGIPTGNKGNGSSGSGSGGNTKYPTADELEDNDKTNNDEEDEEQEEKELFGDISNYGWAKDAIEGLYYAGIVNGMEENVFNPAGEVTREQFCKMVVQMFGIYNEEVGDKFGDVKADAWYAPYIYSAVRAGYIQGQSDDFFGIGQPIMRQDMVTVLYRALKNVNNSAELNFTDNDNIAEYAKEAVAKLVGMGVINGYEDGSFKPRGTATRAEAAKVIWGVYQTIK